MHLLRKRCFYISTSPHRPHLRRGDQFKWRHGTFNHDPKTVIVRELVTGYHVVVGMLRMVHCMQDPVPSSVTVLSIGKHMALVVPF